MNSVQEIQDEFWVLRQLLVGEKALTPDIRQHLERMRHRIAMKVHNLEKEVEELNDELDELDPQNAGEIPRELPEQPWKVGN
jgi:archaellum component FlaC